MDLVTVVVVALAGLAVVWVVHRAFSNARHAPPTKLRGGGHHSFTDTDIPDLGYGHHYRHRPGSSPSGRDDRSG